MKDAFWGVAIVGIAIVIIFFVLFFQETTNTSEHNYALLKETTEAAMVDALDKEFYGKGYIKIHREKFVENFIRRYAENASLSNTYRIQIYDVNEYPPKVSLRISSIKSTTLTGEITTFDMSNNLSAILEVSNKY